MSDHGHGGDGIGRPIRLGDRQIFGVDPASPFRPGDVGIPGSQRELSHPANRGRLTPVMTGLPVGRETAIFENLGMPGGHPTVLLAVFDRSTYPSFGWRARATWQIGALGMFECIFDVGAIGNAIGTNPIQQGVIWSQPCDLLRLAIINPQGGEVGGPPAQIATAVAWGASPYPFRRPLTFRELGADIGIGQAVVYPVRAYARGMRISASTAVLPAWVNAEVGISFQDATGAHLGGDTMQATSNLQSLALPVAVPLGAVQVTITNQDAADIVIHACEWELSL